MPRQRGGSRNKFRKLSSSPQARPQPGVFCDDGSALDADTQETEVEAEERGDPPELSDAEAPESPDGVVFSDAGVDTSGLNTGGYMDTFISKLSRFQASALDLFRHAALLLVTTHYSGVGMFECAIAKFMAVDSKPPPQTEPKLVVAHSCDIAPRCRKALLRHQGPTAAMHIGGDICNLIPPERLAEMREKVKEAANGWRDAAKRHQSEKTTAKQVRAAKSEHSFALLDMLLGILSDPAEFKHEAHCYKHGCCCPVRQEPRSVFKSAEGQVYTVNTAGTTCVAHSSRGTRAGLIDDTILPFTIWAKERLIVQEALILHECTAHHPSEAVFKHLFDKLYQVFVFKLCPSTLGFGCKRLRMFTILVRKDILLTAVPVPRTPVCLFASPVANFGSVYFVDDSAPLGNLSVGDLARLRQHIDRITECGYSVTDDFLIDVTQAPGFGCFQRLVPCLLRSCKVYSLKRKRLMTGAEAVRMMHGGCEPPWDIDDFPNAFHRSCAGNGVHVPSVVALLIWATVSVMSTA